MWPDSFQLVTNHFVKMPMAILLRVISNYTLYIPLTRGSFTYFPFTRGPFTNVPFTSVRSRLVLLLENLYGGHKIVDTVSSAVV